MVKTVLVGVVLLSLLGCVATYRDFPEAALDRKPVLGSCDMLQYQVKRFDVLDTGGYNALLAVLRTGGFCRKTVSVDARPEKGLYVEIDAKWKPLSLPALVFGYISAATLTLLPAWSMHDGYLVRYHVFVDGQQKDTYSYEITRKAGLWIGLLPFAWANLFTYSEAEAFEATAYQFVEDGRYYFTGSTP